MAASAPMATNLLLAFYHYHIYGEAEPAMHIVLQEYNALSAPEARGSPSHFWLHLLNALSTRGPWKPMTLLATSSPICVRLQYKLRNNRAPSKYFLCTLCGKCTWCARNVCQCLLVYCAWRSHHNLVLKDPLYFPNTVCIRLSKYLLGFAFMHSYKVKIKIFNLVSVIVRICCESIRPRKYNTV